MLLFSPLSDELPQPSTDFEREALAFCHAWRNGQTEFRFHTSGSTGTPKPIDVHREAMIASATATGTWLNLAADDVVLACLPIQYIAGAMVLVRALVWNMRVCLVEPSVNPLLDLNPISIHLASFVPNQWHAILASSVNLHDYFSESKGILLGGASLPENLAKSTIELPFPIFETYGMTETVSHVAYKKPLESHFCLLDSIEADIDERQCLRLKGSVTANAWVQTNDRVTLGNHRKFEYLGRYDRVINSAGRKIQPEKLEQCISKIMPSDFEFFIDSLPDEQLGNKAYLFYSGQFSENAKEELLIALKHQFESWELPKAFIYLSEFQFTPTGKIDRLKSVALYLKSL